MTLEEACRLLQAEEGAAVATTLSLQETGDEGAVALLTLLLLRQANVGGGGGVPEQPPFLSQPHQSSLVELSLTHCRLTVVAAKSIAAFCGLVPNNTNNNNNNNNGGGGGGNLQRLYLQSNQLGDDGAELLAGALLYVSEDGCCRCSSLRVLNLARNNIGDIGAAAIAEALTGDMNSDKDDDEYNASYTTVTRIGRMGLNSSSLQKLYLYENKIGDLGAEALAEAAVTDYSCLQELFVWDNVFGLQGMEYLAMAANRRKDLHLKAVWNNHNNSNNNPRRSPDNKNKSCAQQQSNAVDDKSIREPFSDGDEEEVSIQELRMGKSCPVLAHLTTNNNTHCWENTERTILTAPATHNEIVKRPKMNSAVFAQLMQTQAKAMDHHHRQNGETGSANESPLHDTNCEATMDVTGISCPNLCANTTSSSQHSTMETRTNIAVTSPATTNSATVSPSIVKRPKVDSFKFEELMKLRAKAVDHSEQHHESDNDVSDASLRDFCSEDNSDSQRVVMGNSCPNLVANTSSTWRNKQQRSSAMTPTIDATVSPSIVKRPRMDSSKFQELMKMRASAIDHPNQYHETMDISDASLGDFCSEDNSDAQVVVMENSCPNSVANLSPTLRNKQQRSNAVAPTIAPIVLPSIVKRPKFQELMKVRASAIDHPEQQHETMDVSDASLGDFCLQENSESRMDIMVKSCPKPPTSILRNKKKATQQFDMVTSTNAAVVAPWMVKRPKMDSSKFEELVKMQSKATDPPEHHENTDVSDKSLGDFCSEDNNESQMEVMENSCPIVVTSPSTSILRNKQRVNAISPTRAAIIPPSTAERSRTGSSKFEELMKMHAKAIDNPGHHAGKESNESCADIVMEDIGESMGVMGKSCPSILTNDDWILRSKKVTQRSSTTRNKAVPILKLPMVDRNFLDVIVKSRTGATDQRDQEDKADELSLGDLCCDYGNSDSIDQMGKSCPDFNRSLRKVSVSFSPKKAKAAFVSPSRLTIGKRLEMDRAKFKELVRTRVTAHEQPEHQEAAEVDDASLSLGELCLESSESKDTRGDSCPNFLTYSIKTQRTTSSTKTNATILERPKTDSSSFAEVTTRAKAVSLHQRRNEAFEANKSSLGEVGSDDRESHMDFMGKSCPILHHSPVKRVQQKINAVTPTTTKAANISPRKNFNALVRSHAMDDHTITKGDCVTKWEVMDCDASTSRIGSPRKLKIRITKAKLLPEVLPVNGNILASGLGDTCSSVAALRAAVEERSTGQLFMKLQGNDDSSRSRFSVKTGRAEKGVDDMSIELASGNASSETLNPSNHSCSSFAKAQARFLEAKSQSFLSSNIVGDSPMSSVACRIGRPKIQHLETNHSGQSSPTKAISKRSFLIEEANVPGLSERSTTPVSPTPPSGFGRTHTTTNPLKLEEAPVECLDDSQKPLAMVRAQAQAWEQWSMPENDLSLSLLAASKTEKDYMHLISKKSAGVNSAPVNRAKAHAWGQKSMPELNVPQSWLPVSKAGAESVTPPGKKSFRIGSVSVSPQRTVRYVLAPHTNYTCEDPQGMTYSPSPATSNRPVIRTEKLSAFLKAQGIHSEMKTKHLEVSGKGSRTAPREKPLEQPEMSDLLEKVRFFLSKTSRVENDSGVRKG